jgi:peroxiredoxin
MTSSKTATRPGEAHRRKVVSAAHKAQERHSKQARRRRITITSVVLAALVAVVSVMMYTSRATTSTATRTAPGFTLPDTAGHQVNLASYRGHNVVLYFSEGAGCGACLQQMAAIEKDAAKFKAANVSVLPIVMNTRDQIMADMHTYGVKTPFLLDDGTVSAEYKTLGKGMHAGLPGHSFVLIDKNGVQRWYGEFPSMWLDTQTLLKDVRNHLPA